MKKSEKKPIRISRETLLCLPVFFGLLICAFCIVCSRFSLSYLPKTEIHGISCTSQVPEDVLAEILRDAQSKEVSLRDDSDEVFLSLPLSDFLQQEHLLQQLKDSLAEQHSERSVFAWMSPQEYSYDLLLFDTLTTGDISSIISRTLYLNGGRESPDDAFLIYDGSVGYNVVEETSGSFFRSWDCAESVASALAEMDTRQKLVDCTLSVTTARVTASVTTESPMLHRETDSLDAYIQAEITVDFLSGTLITLTPEEITSVGTVSINGLTATYEPDLEKVKVLADSLLDEYALEGPTAKYARCENTRETITYPDWDEGWILNRDAFEESLFNAIASHEDTIITPEYDSTYSLRNLYGCDHSLIEISLDNQYMWMYVNDKLIVETPVVTGCIATYDFTRQGFFCINWMEEDLYLSGPTWYDHVDYWMPFDGGIGIHDSSWRTEYGGDIYLEEGSHGCINTPLEAVRTIYENAWFYMQVIVW